MKHKVLAILLCLAMVLTMALPGTLAVSADEDSSESQLTTDVCTCGAEDNIHAEDCPLYVQPELPEEEPVCTCGAEDDNHAEDCPLFVQPELPEEKSVCTCGAEDDNHAEDCPLYVAPEEDPICTCNTEDDIHAEDCPLYDADDDSETEEPTESTEEEEEPEGTPPESWGSASLTGAVSFTNVAPLMQFDYGLATLELNDEDYGISPVAENDNGVVLNKTAKANDNGTFDITLEAYVTGEQTTVSHYDPADIVLVLDTSGSMYAGMQESDFEAVYSSSVSIDPDSYYDCYRKYWVIEDGEFVNACVINTNSVKNNNATPQWRTQKNWYTSGSTFYPKTSTSDSASDRKQFYVVKSGQSRMDSLKTSVNSFISNVFTTSADSSIAIVPFGTNVGTVTGFTSNQAVLSNAVAALTPNGGTNSGAAMAKSVELLNSDAVKNNGRKKVVVMFTDGTPCSSGDTFDDSIANTAISNSYTLKTNGVTVYTVGVFSGANGAISSVGSSNENTYMHYVSSNYPEATSMTNSGVRNNELNGKSYYLSATNSLELLNIFQLISQQVGGATNSTLGTTTVVKDIIAPSFDVPANASDIKLYTANCTGAGLTFGNRTPATGVTATIMGDTLNVTGFDFSNNWCGNHSGTYSGKKLIIEFTVSPKDGFLGGNNVNTNGAESGVYDKDGNAIGIFPQPEANVTIKKSDTEIESNVYLGGYYGQTLTGEQIKENTTITIGGVELDLTKNNYGLQDWQMEYVDIVVTIKDKDGNEYASAELTDDLEYTVTVTIKPKADMDGTDAEGTPNDMSGKDTKASGKINVFKPELTFKDSDVWYGDTAPESYNGNLTKTRWVHYGADGAVDKVDTASNVNMMGIKPTLTITYTPETGKIEDNKIATKQDIAVDVTVKIVDWNVTEFISFQHTDCTGKTCGKPENGKFWLHVKTCQLTITKTGGADNESYVFDVYKDNEKYTEVTIWGNGSETIYELPVGTYTIQENTGWSWRYDANYGSAATLAAQNTSGSITCTNTLNTNKWLNGFSTIVKNIFDVKPEQTSN